MKNNKKICVVGASGLVGSSIVRHAVEKGYFVHILDGNDIRAYSGAGGRGQVFVNSNKLKQV